MTAATYDIVGCGTVVRLLHEPVLQALVETGEIRIGGCYDRDSRLAREVAERIGAQRWGSDASPREGDGVDAALIATPPAAHAEIARRYVRCHKSVLVEKPFTATATEAAELAEEAEERGVTVAVNQFWRYYPNREIGRRFLDGRLGDVRSIEATEGSRWDWVSASSYMTDDPYGGVIHDTGTHVIDMALYLLGLDEADGVSVETGTVNKSPCGEPSHECMADVTLGVPGSGSIEMRVIVSRLRPLAPAVKIRGSFGTLLVPTAAGDAPLLFRGGNGFRLSNAEPVAEVTSATGGFLLAHRDFLRAMGDRDPSTRIDATRFLLLMDILESLHGKAGS